MVRVSRRVNENHFVSISCQYERPQYHDTNNTSIALLSKHWATAGNRTACATLPFTGTSVQPVIDINGSRTSHPRVTSNFPSVKASLTSRTHADSPLGTEPLSRLPAARQRPKDHLPPQTVHRPDVNIPRRTTGCHRFLLNNFKYFLTLFSKFFSSFPHGTCSLSVSR